MKRIMMLTLMLSVMAMGSAMANESYSDRGPKRGKGVVWSHVLPPPVHHCCGLDHIPHHKCDKRVSHHHKGFYFGGYNHASKRPHKCGKAGDNRPPRGKNHKSDRGHNRGGSARR